MQCNFCLKVLSNKSSVSRHKRESCPERFNKGKKVKLNDDLDVVTSANNYNSTIVEATPFRSIVHPVTTTSNVIECQDCYKKISGRGLTGHLRSNSHKSVISNDCGVEKLSSAFKNRIGSYRLSSNKHHTDHLESFSEIEGNVLKLLHNYLHKFKVLKVNFELYSMYTIPEKDTYDLKSFNTKNQIITISTNLKQAYQDFIREILPKVSEIQEKESGWSLLQIQSLEVNINKYNPLRSSSYIRLPRQIEMKKAIINIMNKDEACFCWAVNASIFDPTERLRKHEDNDCNFVYTKLPTTNMILNKYGHLQKENILQFSNFQKQMQVPFVIYADFESILQPIQYATPSDNSPFTVKTYQHTPYSFGFYVKCYFDDSLSQLIIYRGDNVVEKFIQKLEEKVYTIYHRYLKHIKPMKKLTPEEELQFFTIDRGDLERNIYLKLGFVDSFRLLPHSLDNLSKTLNDNQCLELQKYCRSNEEFGLLRQKGVFPYSYLDNFSKLDEVSLPTQEEFFDILKGEGISDEKYLRAKRVWEVFNCNTLGEYSDVYLKSDILLLADVFENFRHNCLFNYKLDPAQYLTAPSLSWDAMLRKTNVQLELLTDIDMLHFFKKGIRGGISQCSTRFAAANNQYCGNYDCSKPTSYILYLDATNLYGYAMSQFLPHVDDESPKGYVLEVDLAYPETLHDFHNDLPFCPENLIPPNSKDPKLVLTLLPKNKYIIHYRNLKQCTEQGLKVTKIHRILEFSQSPWLKPYIELNTNLRNSSNNEFDKSTYKNYTNSIYGKTMENVDKRVDIKLLSHWDNLPGSVGAEGFISMPNFHSVSIFSDNLVAIQMNILKIIYDKPVYVGFSILEISKIRMYDFFYNYIKAKYVDNVALLYTDTDSLILHIQIENVYRDIKENLHLFDTSNYPADNIFNIPKTPSVVGKLKDEFKGKSITNFCGTGAKAYCVTLSNNDNLKKAKGISKNVINKSLTFTDYKQVVDNTNAKIYRKMYTFKSHLHEMYTELKNKVALTSHDDKRYVIPGTINTLAWGHYKIDTFIPNQQQKNLDYLIQQAKLLLPEAENDGGDEFYVDSFEMDFLS
ncbi:uncharacterized protein [Diabrotica undecimpunctata]|uniref:uncharacterized protein n=1 Tax=Diabrotica undecimpunctata TaxID=50387 RepID=UPI003B63ED82